ncbi:uncharacterized protein LOC119588229 [Penaeus monodon]|uniref:uncharacterized protein LOC119588229 n=1 Tax=Penaeus monodon TaxID=6687 RepID=UPI0018A75816|nr:uncharacterized protein LOC119588229 [Penaeus monodon]
MVCLRRVPFRRRDEMKLLAAVLVVGSLGVCKAWDEHFRSSECYKYGLESLDERMPQNLGNLVALIEKWEEEHQYGNAEDIAEGIIKRYKIDGIVYLPSGPTFWGQNEQEEADKFDVVKRVLVPTEEVPRDMYFPERRGISCALHFLTTHSTDMYPHAGIGDVWDTRRRRRRSESPPQNVNARYSLPQDVDPARHPIENGVMLTPYGPVAVGTLLSGIMASDKTSEVTVQQIYGKDVEYMHPEMLSSRLHPQHVSTLAGDIGQTALVSVTTTTTSNTRYLGPQGMFGNSTAAPKLFTLETSNDGIISYLTRAEVFAGIDALLIQKVLQSSTSSTLKLSQVLRMYYSDRGLPDHSDFRACNRMEAFKQIDKTKIEQQALNFMYAYAHHFNEIQRLIKENDFQTVNEAMQAQLNKAMSVFNSFVGSYNYEDYSQCPIYSSSQVKTENQVDLLVVYAHEGGTTEMEKQREYITHLANMLGIGKKRSRLGIMDGKKAEWITPMTNFSNVADWCSNFTEDESQSYGSGSDMPLVLDKLEAYYSGFYKDLRSDGNNAEAHSQVCCFKIPLRFFFFFLSYTGGLLLFFSSPSIDSNDFYMLMKNFRLNYPDVYFLMVGKSKGSYNDILLDISKDFFTNNALEQEDFAKDIAKRVLEIPSVFVYPACDSNNANFTNYREQNHLYTGYVSPNHTTYVHIAPHNFRFSGYVKIMVSSSDVKVCTSRESMAVASNAQDYTCIEDDGDFEFSDLCGRYLEDCKPIFMSITGKPTIGSRCTDERCEYPDQVKFEIRHEGMICGAWCTTSSLVLLCASLLVHLFR